MHGAGVLLCVTGLALTIVSDLGESNALYTVLFLELCVNIQLHSHNPVHNISADQAQPPYCCHDVSCTAAVAPEEDSENALIEQRAIKGDLLCLLGATMYGISNVMQESIVKNHDRYSKYSTLYCAASVTYCCQYKHGAIAFLKTAAPSASTSHTQARHTPGLYVLYCMLQQSGVYGHVWPVWCCAEWSAAAYTREN
eukprot:21231-Heterococcus_DN1.PRE.7